MHPGKLKTALNVCVVSRPDKINNFMMVGVEDEYGSRTQCCLFGDICHRYKDIIQIGNWYRIEDPTLQANNRTNIMEFKITKDSSITRINRVEQQQAENRPMVGQPRHNNQLKEYNAADYSEEGVSRILCQTTAQITGVYNDEGKGRDIKAVNKEGQRVFLFLWKEN